MVGGGERPFRSLVSYLQRQASSRPVGHNTDIAIIGLGYRLQLQVQARSVCLASGGPRQGRERHRSTQQYVHTNYNITMPMAMPMDGNKRSVPTLSNQARISTPCPSLRTVRAT